MGVFGPAHLYDRSGNRHDIDSEMQRRVLAALVLDVGRSVRTELLIDRIWLGQPPKTARPALQVHISGLRRRLAATDTAASIETTTHGYQLVIDADSATDVAEFETMVRDARADAESNPRGALDLLAVALDRWGIPYLDLADDHDTVPEITRLERIHQTAFDEWFELRLAEPTPELAAELEARTVTNPEHERAWRQLVTALLAIGERRRAEAVARSAPVTIALPTTDGADDAEVIAELALLGRVPTVDHFLASTNRSTTDVLAAIDRAVANGVLERTSETISFLDEQTRVMEAARLSSTDRCRAHNRYAAFYGGLIAAPGFEFLTIDERAVMSAAYADHADAARPIGDAQRAITANVAAAAALERMSWWADAAVRYRRAMDGLDAMHTPEATRQRYQTSIRLGTCLVRSGDTAAGSTILRNAIEVARDVGDDAGFGEAVRRYIEYLPPPASAADPVVAPLLAEAIDRTDGHTSETRVQLLVDRATAVHLAAPLAERERWARAALDAADSEDLRSTGLALTGRIGATWGPSTTTRRLDDARRAQQVATSAGTAATDTMMTAVLAEAVTSLEVGDRSRFDQCLEHGRQRCSDLEQAPRIRWWFDSWRTIQLALDNRLDEAIADSDAVVATSQGAEFEALATLLSQQVMFAVFGRLRSGLGDDLAMVPVDDSAPELAASLSVVRAVEGDEGEARRLHRRAAATFDPAMDNLGTAITLALLAEGAWRLGDPTEVLHLLPTIERLGEHHAVLAIYGGGGFALGPLAHAAAQLHLLTDSPAANEWVARTIDHCRAARSPLLTARAEALA